MTESLTTTPIEDAASSQPESVAHADAQAWDAFVDQHSLAHVLQVQGWGALKARFGWRAQTVSLATTTAGGIEAGALLLFKRSLGLTLGYVPRGPLLDWEDDHAVASALATLRAAARAGGASVLKLEPELPDTPANRARLARHGLTPSLQTVQPRSTIMVDLAQGADAALAKMKSKWRYNVRLAQRKGVTVRECTRADLPVVAELMRATAARDNFDVHDAAYYAAAFDLLVPEHAVFLLAEYAGAPLAAIVVTIAGRTAWYLWGASSDRERNRMPNHALQWAGMQWAAARGAQRYDLWGIPDEVGALAQGLRDGDGSGTPADALPVNVDALPSHGLWGVYRFKQGFGGDVVRMVGAWDMPVNRLGSTLYQLGLRALAAKRSLQEQRAARTTAAQAARSEDITTPAAWQQTLTSLPAPHVLQSWEWGAVKAQTGWRAERLALAEGKAAFQLLTRQPLPGLPLRIGYVPKGPVLDWTDSALVERTLVAIEAHARARQCIVVKIDPDVLAHAPAGVALRARLQRRGWLYSNEQVQFKNTAVSDLTPDAESLLAGMKSKWRYNIRLAEKRGITVRTGSMADLDVFHALYAETGARDGFLIRPADYYRATWRAFLRAQEQPGNPAGGALLLAEHPDEDAPLAGIFLLRYGATTWYFYGASSDRRRRDMPNHLLQWRALQWAKAQGCMRYDWWGAPTDPEDETDAMQGVWGFKQGFGAQLQEHIGAWDYPVQPLLYKAYTQALPRVLAFMRRRAQAG